MSGEADRYARGFKPASMYYVCSSVRLCVRLCGCLSVRLCACLYACVFVCLSVCLYVCVSVRLCVCLSVRLCVCLSVRLSVCPTACLCILSRARIMAPRLTVYYGQLGHTSSR